MVLSKNINIATLRSILAVAGAYEPPKAAKEHETRFHDYPNYIKIFENSVYIIRGVLVIETETSCEIECDDVQQEVEVRTVTPFRHQQLTRNPQLYMTTQGNSPPLLFVSSRAFHVLLQITRFHFPYMEST